MQARTVVVFQTHFFDRWAASAFRRLQRQCSPNAEAIVLCHGPAGSSKPERLKDVPHHFVTTPEIRTPDYPGKSLGPNWNLWSGGHTDLILLHFFRSHPDYDRYWNIEYDVRFSGSWRHLFEALDADDADLLAPCVTSWSDHPGWPWWPTLRPAEAIDETCRLRGFLPVFRASRELLAAVDQAYRDGWGGHCEATWPTIAAAKGLVVRDIGGNGPFTPAARRGRFYTNSPLDICLAPGTLVFKPTLWRAGSQPNMLWHPVKPFWWRQELRQGLQDLRNGGVDLLRAAAPWAEAPLRRALGLQPRSQVLKEGR